MTDIPYRTTRPTVDALQAGVELFRMRGFSVAADGAHVCRLCRYGGMVGPGTWRALEAFWRVAVPVSVTAGKYALIAVVVICKVLYLAIDAMTGEPD